MTRARVSWIVLSGALVFGGAAYLYDPPWVGQITSGLGEWRTDPSGMRYRWTNGHATFFVPSKATAMMLPLRAQFQARRRIRRSPCR